MINIKQVRIAKYYLVFSNQNRQLFPLKMAFNSP
jgi:hypothetical protein